ncbi:unannotated protein [freshwater metagenome]|uniref:Unannotated protein n=1 Tax=freshwater metagenome TaxID=449393 RepID=A0A6J5ZP30_9ZZZZ
MKSFETFGIFLAKSGTISRPRSPAWPANDTTFLAYILMITPHHASKLSAGSKESHNLVEPRTSCFSIPAGAPTGRFNPALKFVTPPRETAELPATKLLAQTAVMPTATPISVRRFLRILLTVVKPSRESWTALGRSYLDVSCEAERCLV